MTSMRPRSLSFAVLLACATAAFAVPPTPTPVDSNIAVSVYAQNHGVYAVATPSPCTIRGGNGCGGCYPAPIPGIDPTTEILKVDPEWSAIGDMIPSPTPGSDTSVPPASNPVLLKGTVALTKINVGGDFPGSHITDDQNTFITPDSDFNGVLANGNSAVTSCPGEGCSKVEMELETGKYPLFAWAGEGDHVTALGRWIFDCGHPDPAPMGGCSVSGAPCIIDADCANPQTCTNPPPNFTYRAEMHPPQAIAVVRNKSIKKLPATQADVYVTADGGGASDVCTVTHLASQSQVLFNKACFLSHCSKTTGRSCQIDKDCAGGEKCIVFASTTDATKRVVDVNAQNFEFDMPLPPAPPAVPSPATLKDLKITLKSFKPAGGIMPKATFQPTFGPTPNLHVIIPMAPATPLPSGKLPPNVFAERISAGWKADTTALTHMQVKFTKLTVKNPLKDRVSAIPRQCLLVNGGLSNKACSTDADCLAGTCNKATTKACHTDKDCAKTDFCIGGARCAGGVTPGWDVYGQVNGDWVRFSNLQSIGNQAPFLTPPYAPGTQDIPEKFTFDEYLPSNGSLHIATSGHSLNCLDTLYGANVKDSLGKYGLTLGGACLAAADADPGRVDITHNGSNLLAAPPNGLCTGPNAPFTCCTGAGTGTCAMNDACTAVGDPFACCTGSETGTCPEVACVPPVKAGAPTTCTASSTGGDGGTCSITTTHLCTSDADCPGACAGAGVPSGPCETASDCQHCSTTTSKFCASNFDCPAGTCDNNHDKACHTHADCAASGSHCSIGSPETCVASAGATCTNIETCNGTCAENAATCHTNADCGVNGPCVKGGDFTVQYTIQVK